MKIYIFLILTVLLICCSPSKSENGKEIKLKSHSDENLVKILVLKKETFKEELISNGKLRALSKSDLKLSLAGQLVSLKVKNGQYILAGQSIGLLNQFEYKQEFEKANTAFNTASLDLEDLLLGRGFEMKDSLKVPKNIFKMAKIRSGYFTAQSDLAIARYNLQNTILRAPFSGKVANLKYNQFEQVSSGEIFCTIIDDSQFEVEFYLMESEIKDVSLNDEVRVIPFSTSTSIKGYVSQINPVIDKHGMIMVKARVKNTRGDLMEGMNVKVIVEKKVGEQLVVPKSAIVLRQNQEVLFKYENGKAFWIYVETDFENSNFFSVKAHSQKGGNLGPGDTVIISNNLNLAHKSDVAITK